MDDRYFQHQLTEFLMKDTGVMTISVLERNEFASEALFNFNTTWRNLQAR